MIWGLCLNQKKVSLKPGTKVLSEDAMEPAATLLFHLNGSTYDPINPYFLKFLLLCVLCILMEIRKAIYIALDDKSGRSTEIILWGH